MQGQLISTSQEKVKVIKPNPLLYLTLEFERLVSIVKVNEWFMFLTIIYLIVKLTFL